MKITFVVGDELQQQSGTSNGVWIFNSSDDSIRRNPQANFNSSHRM